MELFVDLPRGSGPLRRRLEHELREGVRAGRLLPGATLPSTRALAAQLGVSRGMVVEAYAQLVAEGYLRARQGAGTTVAPRVRAGVAAASPASTARPPAAVVYDFRYGTPDLSSFPRAAWQACGARVLRALPDARLSYGDPRGAIELREALAAYLGRARGVVAHPDRIVITGGTRLGLGLVWHVLRAAGSERVAVEDPGWTTQQATVRDAGLDPVAVAVDGDGMTVGALAALGVDAAVVTPAHQCPTGALLAPGRRTELLEWARAGNRVVVEDDYDAEYRYDRDPVSALQGMAPEHVIYAGSASKTLAPALRIGWLVLPAPLALAAGARRTVADRAESLLTQLTLADLVARGDLDRHLRRTRRRYRARRDALVAAVAAELPGAHVEGIAAGLHAVVRMAPGVDEARTVSVAAERGIALHGLAAFRQGEAAADPALVLGYANMTEQAITRGVAELARAMR